MIVLSQVEMVHHFSSYLQRLKMWINEQSSNVSIKSIVLTETGYPSSSAGLTTPFANLPGACIGNDTGNFTLQDMAFRAFGGECNKVHDLTIDKSSTIPQIYILLACCIDIFYLPKC